MATQAAHPLALSRLSKAQLVRLHKVLPTLPPDQIEDVEDFWCQEDCLLWLQKYTKTENKHYLTDGLEFKAPFPKKAYFAPLFDAFSNYTHLFIPKSREMMTSWCVMGWSSHRAQWHQEETIVQTESEDKAAELVDYVRQLYDNQVDFLKGRHPLKTRGAYEIAWESGGRVISIPKGEHKIRLYHPTRYVMDEAAFLPEAEACYNAAAPVARQIIAISSAGPGWFANQCSR